MLTAIVFGVLCLLAYIVGYCVGRAGGWQDGYDQRSDECRMRRCSRSGWR